MIKIINKMELVISRLNYNREEKIVNNIPLNILIYSVAKYGPLGLIKNIVRTKFKISDIILDIITENNNMDMLKYLEKK